MTPTPQVFVVLGMHKSGTTLVAEILHKAGIAMEDSLDEPVGYEHGHTLERAAAQAVNRLHLGCGDDSSHDIELPETGPDPAIRQASLAQATALIADLSQRGTPWGFKDPRTLLTLPVWEDAFARAPVQPCLIGVYRNPVEVFGHYKRLLRRKWLHRDPGYLLRVLRSWCAHNRALLDLARRGPDLALFEFAALMTQETEMQRLYRVIGTSGQDPRRAGLYRARATEDRDYRIARALLRLGGTEAPEALFADLERLRAAQVTQAGARA